ncbi:MAG: ATP-binding protein [Desulfobacteraceae bacterium]
MKTRLRLTHKSIAVKLFINIAVVMTILFILDHVIMLELSSQSLIEQGKLQIQLQQKRQQERIAQAEAQLLQKLEMQLDLLAKFVKGPLTTRATEKRESVDVPAKFVERFRFCLQLNSDAEIAQCLKYRTHRVTGDAMAAVKRALIVSAIHALLDDADLFAIQIEDWEQKPYVGFAKTSDNQVSPFRSRDELPAGLDHLVREVKAEWEYWGKIDFFYSSQRIEAMRQSAKSEIAEAIKLIERNIADQRSQLLRKRIIEGALIFALLMAVIFFASYRTVLRPLKRLKKNAHQLARGDLDCPIEPHRSDELGELASSFADMRDAIREQIKRLKTVNQDLRRNQERLRAFIQALPDATYVFNSRGICEEVLVAKDDQLFSAAVMHKGGSLQDCLPAELARPFMTAITHALESGSTQINEYRSETHGETRWFEGRLSPMRSADGVLDMTICMAREITHRKEAERLHKEKIAAEAANEAKSAFLATMSHEIRTPMNAILGMADLLWESALTNDQKKYVSVFRNAGKSLLNIINDILDLSKIESGHLEVEFNPFHLIETVENVCENFAFHANENNLELICTIDPQLPSWFVGDRLRLRQVLANLVGNAIKFTHCGEIEVSAAILPCPQSDAPPLSHPEQQMIHFSVRDTGIGIAQKNQAHIFDRFTQAESESTRNYEGTGLGLTICRHLVEKMGGKIWLESRTGQGATFSFVVQLEQMNIPPDAFQSRIAHTDHPLRVLLVDDNAAALSSMKKMISGFGLQVQAAGDQVSGSRALSDACDHQKPFDILLIDAQMHLTEQFKTQLQAHRRIADRGHKLFLLITHLYQKHPINHLPSEVDGYFIKPLRRNELIEAIDLAAGKTIPSKACRKAPRAINGQGLESLRILLVEDNINNQMLFKYYIEECCQRIDVAQNGSEGVHKFKTAKYDLVFMDLAMPVMDGYEATRAIRRWEADQGADEVPIVALTADALKGREQKSLSAGCTDHITKPFTKNQILEILHQHGPQGQSKLNAVGCIEYINSDLKGLIPSFIHNTLQEIKILEEAINQNDWPTIERMGHSIKGSSFGYGFKRMGLIGRRVQAAASETHGREKLPGLLKELIDYTQNVQVVYV